MPSTSTAASDAKTGPSASAGRDRNVDSRNVDSSLDDDPNEGTATSDANRVTTACVGLEIPIASTLETSVSLEREFQRFFELRPHASRARPIFVHTMEPMGCARSHLLATAFAAAACGSCNDVTVPVLWRTSPAVPADGGTNLPLRYEAEATPPNILTQSATVDLTCFGTSQTCPAGGLKEGADCCSAGGVVTEILGRVPCSGPPGDAGDYVDCQMTGAGVEFRSVTVPSAGTYDVTWWYHCGENNSYGDTACGGLHYSVGSSCRPHLIDVNGMPMSAETDGQAALIYQFPCYAGAWSIVHGATTNLPLVAGQNIVLLHAPHELNLDSADIDAIDVQVLGQGPPPVVTPVVSGF